MTDECNFRKKGRPVPGFFLLIGPAVRYTVCIPTGREPGGKNVTGEVVLF